MRILQLFCSFSSTVDQTFRSTEDRFGLLNYMGLMLSDGIYGCAALLQREVLAGSDRTANLG